MVSLFDSQALNGTVFLKNRIVMAPMTRTRTSDGDVPNELMAIYYGQRASAGLIVTEATDVAPSSKGYALTPGIHTEAQQQGWRLVTDEVHRNDGTIFLQLWHVGRMAHPSLMPNGEAPWGVTEARAEHSDVFAHDTNGKLDFIRAGTPRRLETIEVEALVDTFSQSFANARRAGFDGVEIHGANGYLVDQFLNSALNTRTDRYGGGNVQDRTRFLVDVVDAAVRELGPGRVGVRLSPFGTYNSMPPDPLAEETLLYLCELLGSRGVAYLHLVYQLMPAGNMESSEFKERHIEQALLTKVRAAFPGAIIWCGGITSRESAQAALETRLVDLIAFGRPYIANPDLVERLQRGWPLAEALPSTFYTRHGEVGYTDFPTYSIEQPEGR
ncbi:1,2-oxophytodienoate reductase [Hydrogenophaga sp. Root209]|uniref:alkene reductase n=1 Tax=Hydrogenophaga sp. Root209 TaxID=1736490 RepID=UPI0006F243EE|nr:alkene reductase [Hydrogenophaga sp. Root209]KRC04546.1 1,2-oxophytodienoate reductase [Hydrogenophaga sp. Root209]